MHCAEKGAPLATFVELLCIVLLYYVGFLDNFFGKEGQTNAWAEPVLAEISLAFFPVQP